MLGGCSAGGGAATPEEQHSTCPLAPEQAAAEVVAAELVLPFGLDGEAAASTLSDDLREALCGWIASDPFGHAHAQGCVDAATCELVAEGALSKQALPCEAPLADLGACLLSAASLPCQPIDGLLSPAACDTVAACGLPPSASAVASLAAPIRTLLCRARCPGDWEAARTCRLDLDRCVASGCTASVEEVECGESLVPVGPAPGAATEVEALGPLGQREGCVAALAASCGEAVALDPAVEFCVAAAGSATCRCEREGETCGRTFETLPLTGPAAWLDAGSGLGAHHGAEVRALDAEIAEAWCAWSLCQLGGAGYVPAACDHNIAAASVPEVPICVQDLGTTFAGCDATLGQAEACVIAMLEGSDPCHRLGRFGACAQTGEYESCHLLLRHEACEPLVGCLEPEAWRWDPAELPHGR